MGRLVWIAATKTGWAEDATPNLCQKGRRNERMGELNNVCVMVCGRCRGDSRLQSYLLGTEIMADLTGQYGGAYQDHKERQADAAPIPPTEGDEMSKRCEVEEVWSDCHRTYCQQHKKCAVAAQSEPCQPLAAPIPPEQTGDALVEGMYQKMWKDFVSLQRGDAKQICVEAELYRKSLTAPIPPTPSQQEALGALSDLTFYYAYGLEVINVETIIEKLAMYFIRARPDEVTK